MKKTEKINYKGKKFNSLLIIEELKKDGRLYFKCECDCGKIKMIQKYKVINNLTKSCGHLRSLIGRRFGKLVVLEDTRKKTSSGEKQYLCQCDCGNKKIINSFALSSLRVQSCGCQSRKYDDLSGKKFGKILVLKEVEKLSNGQRQFLCQCDCGREKKITGHDLLANKEFSCICTIKRKKIEHNNLIKAKQRRIDRERALSNSKSGIRGVYQDQKGRWRAMIVINRKCINFYGGIDEEGKQKCIKWRRNMMET